MGKLLSILLDRPEHEIAKIINQLEQASGYPSEDVRFASDYSQRIKSKLRQLRLDPEDTTPEELYHALRAKFEGDSRSLDRALGVAYDAPFANRLEVATKLARLCSGSHQDWFLKPASAKKLLKLQPPKKLQKLLNYRSLDSMLKRENVASLFTALSYTESASWQKSFNRKLSVLSSADFEMREFNVIKLPVGYPANTNSHSLVSTSQLLGVIAFEQGAQFERASVLTMAIQILVGIEELGSKASLQSLAQAHPSLHWWTNAEHLVHAEAQSVSMNLCDVAINHVRGSSFEHRTVHSGRRSLMNELVGRYEQYGHGVSQALPEIFENLTRKTEQVLSVPAKIQLAPEYSLAEQ